MARQGVCKSKKGGLEGRGEFDGVVIGGMDLFGQDLVSRSIDRLTDWSGVVWSDWG